MKLLFELKTFISNVHDSTLGQTQSSYKPFFFNKSTIIKNDQLAHASLVPLTHLSTTTHL